MTFLKQKTVTADYVTTLSDKHFVILESPRYEKIQSLDNPDKVEEKLIIYVELRDEGKSQLDFYPNGTSQKAMAQSWGFDMDKWIGKVGDIQVLQQNVRGMVKNVMYVKAA
jgi:hypothetical protein